jgi:hypothetical protein
MDRTRSLSQYLGNGRKIIMNDNIAKFLYEQNEQLKMMNNKKFNGSTRPYMEQGNKAMLRNSYKYNLTTNNEQP